MIFKLKGLQWISRSRERYYEYLSQKFPALLSGKKGFLNKYKLYLRKRKDSPASATLPCSRRCLILIGFGEYLNYENKL